MRSLGERLKTWRSLFEGMKAHPEDAAALEKEHAELGRVLKEIGEQMYLADKHEAGLREANRRRVELEAQAAELHGRIASLLRGRHGKRNPLLHGFGLEPHGVRGPSKRKRGEAPAEAEALPS